MSSHTPQLSDGRCASQALWSNYTAEMDDLGGFNESVPVYIASGLLTYLSPKRAPPLQSAPLRGLGQGLGHRQG